MASSLTDGLAVGRGVTDVVGARTDDLRELRLQRDDDLARLVDRKRGLRDEGELVGVGDLERRDVVDGLDEDHRVGRLAHRAFDLFVAGVADQDDLVAVGRELLGLDVDLGDQRAGGVDRLELALGGLGVDRRRHAVRAEDDGLALGHLGGAVDEDRSARAQRLDDVLVVDDLLAHVDGRSVDVERVLDRLDGAVDAGAVAARSGEQNLFGNRWHWV